MSLRPYQRDAFQAVMDSVRASTDRILVEAPTGAGKSHIIAAIADELHRVSRGKSVLCIAPRAELVKQNFAKFVQNTGRPASLFSSSLGEKSLRHPVVFGTPQTIKNSIKRFGDRFCAVIIDECHGVTPTIKSIVGELTEKNKNLRVIGTTATPYRLGHGYIYRQDETGRAHGDDKARDPWFARRVYTIEARHLIDNGWLTPPKIGEVEQSYDTSKLEPKSMGRFDSKEVDKAFLGHGRKTAHIVADVVKAAQDRRGVMFFAATIAHAEEIMASLPDHLSAIITGKTKKKERNRIIGQFKDERIKYLVNVDVLTTGFDAPHVDLIAILRATESVALLQQIVGRGLRIAPGKTECLVLDFAGNIDRHCPDGDIFDPEIKAGKEPGSEKLDVECPECSAMNLFSARPDCEDFQITKDGYLVDLAGNIIESEHGPTPAHLGRRCNGMIQVGPESVQCAYRWTSKPCPECEEPNDIAARYCSECKAEIIDPNEKLARQFAAYKADPTKKQCDRVLAWRADPTISNSGNPCRRISITTPHRTFTVWLTDQTGYRRIQAKFDAVKEATMGWVVEPHTVTYKKQKGSRFFELLAINEQEDTLETA